MVLWVYLQMQNPILDLLGTALVPVLGADVAAGSSCHVHFALVGIAALGADPDELTVGVLLNGDLTVIAALLTVVRLGVQLGIHDIIIDKLNDGDDCRKIFLHIRNFYVTDSSSGGQWLERCLKL